MKLAHSVQIRVFSKEGEDEERILNGLKELVPFDIEQEKIKLESQGATGFNEAKIRTFTLLLEKERNIKPFLALLMEKLNAQQKELLIRQKEFRLDEDLNFFIRLDKEKFLNGKVFWITDSGNCYHIKISLAVFPRKREVALNIIEKMLA